MTDMRINLPGYVPERRNGRLRHRVRVEGQKKRRITLPCGPDDPEFLNHYYAAREGNVLAAPKPRPKPSPQTLRGVCDEYLTWLEAQAKAGNMSPLTHKQRSSVLSAACGFIGEDGITAMGDYHFKLPSGAMVHIRDQWGAVTSQADTCTKALRAVYERLIERGRIDYNPAATVKFIHVSKGGAVPWSVEDVKQFLKTHPSGTAAYTWLMLTMFTGARREDLALLGRAHEVRRDGLTWIEWQPGKKGSAFVSMPLLKPLSDAIRAQSVIGPTYLLNQHGRPFKNGGVLGRSVQKWTATAGLENRSSHGLRKALATLLSEYGATQHQIMAVMAHTKASTSEIYTKSAERSRLAKDAMALLDGLKLG